MFLELARDVSNGDDLSIPLNVPVCRERLAICNYTFPHQFVYFLFSLLRNCAIVCAGKSLVCAASVFKILDIDL